MTDSIGAWRQKGRVLRLLGRDIFTIESGDEAAPTILFIHGFPTSSWDWAPLWERLEGYRFVALDLLGFGYSEKPNPHRYRIMEQADLCEALVRERGLDEFHVLVHDYGVTVGQELLARQNEGVGAGTWKSACFLNGGLFPETHRARLIQKLLAGPLGPLVNKLSTKRTFDKSFSAVFGPDTQPSRPELDSFWELINHGGGKHVFHNLISYMADRKEHRDRWVGALRESVVPVALINGSVDPVSGAHVVTRYRELVSPDHFFVELPTIGHYPQVEAPDAVAEGYLRFLQQL